MDYKITNIDWELFPEKYNDVIVHFSDNHREVCRMQNVEIGAMDSLSCGAVRGYLIYVYMYTGEVESYIIVEKSMDIITNMNQYKQKYGK